MITADMSIASVMKLDPEVAPVFMSYGMHCLYCPHASAESIAEASLVHGINADELVKALNQALRGRGGGKPGFAQGFVQAGRDEITAFFG